jgi:hypothetical protein
MSDFRDKLRAEIIASQEERAGFVRQKFTYVIATFGLGTISSQSIPTLKGIKGARLELTCYRTDHASSVSREYREQTTVLCETPAKVSDKF